MRTGVPQRTFLSVGSVDDLQSHVDPRASLSEDEKGVTLFGWIGHSSAVSKELRT